ncbi:MAG: GIY-YIG nuclease family protein [Bacteroidota bacterium]
MFHIYILYSSKSDRYYVGHTHDVISRLDDHNHGNRPGQSKKYTFKHRPWMLKASFEISTNRSEALKVERFIKRQKSRAFIERLIESQYNQEELALCLESR